MKSKTITVNSGDMDVSVDLIAELVQKACGYSSEIHIKSGTVTANVKSIMGMMNLRLDKAGDLVITAEGSDEEEAVQGIADYLLKP